MFDKQKFSNIIQNILVTYENSTIFAETANVNRTYISKILNMKLDNPPTPKVLKKIADSSKGLTTYEELMQVCGYLIKENNDKIREAEKTLKFENLIKNITFTLDEKVVLDKVISTYNHCYNETKSIDKSETKALSALSSYNDNKLDFKKIKKGLKLYIVAEASARIVNKIYEDTAVIDTYYNYKNLVDKSNDLYDDLTDYNFVGRKNNFLRYINIPVVGTVAAGEPILAEQNIVGYEELPEQQFRDGDYFGLKIKR